MYKNSFTGLNTALRGVLAHQAALDVTGHNIANLNTEGYSRQRAELATAQPWSSASIMSQVTPGQLGTGVEVVRIERLRDQFIETNVRQQLGRQASSQALVQQLQQLEASFQEPGPNGLSALMDNFWSAVDQVAANPQGTAARQSMLQAASTLASGFNQLASELASTASISNARLDDTVGQINDISQRIASLNSEIRSAIERGQQPNDLADQRDLLLDKLASYVNFTSSESSTGEVTVTFGAAMPIVLVDPLSTSGYTNITRAQLDTAFTNGDLTGGLAHADESIWNATGGVVPGYLTQLDSLAASLVAGLNAAQAAGSDLNGAAGGNIFDPAGTTAATIRVVMTDPALLAASSSAPGTPQPGNGGNFTTLLNTTRASGQVALGGASWESYYSSTVSSLGTRAQAAQRALDNADVLVDLARARRDQTSGVSLDEEMSNMLRFQHAYNASARVMSTMDEALDILINRMGRVGL